MKTALLFLLLPILTYAQTNVSGGIYTNTTWTKTNSPYIVTDTVVVFPNITLTIEPGVTVKFDDDKRLEIRQARIIANGTSTDSITFTSNSGTPNASSWSEVLLNNCIQSQFTFCNFQFAKQAILAKLNSNADTLAIITYSNFINNSIGIYSQTSTLVIDFCKLKDNDIAITSSDEIRIYNSVISSNRIGVHSNAYGKLDKCVVDSNSEAGIIFNTRNSVTNCVIKDNVKGITDSVFHNFFGSENHILQNQIEQNFIGIEIRGSFEEISCNNICNNFSFGLYYNVLFGSNGIFPNNYWCTTDSATIAATIYDGYDNINLGLVDFMPFDTVQCALLTDIVSNVFENISFKAFPNPFSTQLTFSLADNEPTTVSLYNFLGQQILRQSFTNSTTINTAQLADGIYFYELRNDKGAIKNGKVLKQ